MAEAVDLLLQLPSGRFSRAEMIRLLTHPALNNEGESEIDTEKWRRWSEALGIFFGADDDDLKDTYIPRGLYHWDQAIKRLALGTMMTGQRGGDPAIYANGATEPGYLPAEVAQDDLETAARFMRAARALIADAIAIRDARLTPREWSRMLSEFVSAYIRPEAAVDEQVRDRFLEAIEAVGESKLSVGPMTYESAREIIAARVTDLESRRGQYSEARRRDWIAHVVAIDSIQSDFRARAERRCLSRARTSASRSICGRSSASPATFLRRNAIVIYSSKRSSRRASGFSSPTSLATPRPATTSNLRRSFASCRACCADSSMTTTLTKLTVKHPISRYDSKYFPDLDVGASSGVEHEFVSFDPDARRGARMLALRTRIDPAADENLRDRFGAKLNERLDEELQFAKFETSSNATTAAARTEEIALPIAAIRRYLECPLQGAARYSLGMLEDEDAPEEAEDEPIEQSRLDRAVMLRNVFWRTGGKPEMIAEEYAREVRIAQSSRQRARRPVRRGR